MATLKTIRCGLVTPVRLTVVVLSVLCCAAGLIGRVEPENLALNKPASCSSIENQEHNAAAANDGDPATCWRADDEPEGTPDWWQVDLQRPAELTGCHIHWPFQGMNYRFKVEGSTDLKTWSMLSDQTRTTSTSRVRNLTFKDVPQTRYVKITVTGFDDGCWASLSEVKIFGRP